MSDAHSTCPQCGTQLASGTVRGLCPKCLALVALGGDPEATLKPPSAADDVTRLTPAAGAAVPSAAGSTLRYFGDYELLEEIARGGMGVVWKARQQSLNRVVAVKMIRAGKFAGDAEVKRFHTEAEAAANLQHSNIVAIHEVGEHDGRHYFSMDYVEGRDLAQLVKAGPLPVPVAARYVQTIAGAIAYAHQRGTLHRDLKPHNVLIDQHDQPRITDFGLAKLTKQDSSITQEGAVMGSPSYMPPEQAAGRQAQVGPQSDVYSIGAVLYHLITGKAPFVGATAVETLRQVMDDEPVSPTKLNAKVPADLETICLKCLRKEPAQRYATAQEVADELGRFLNYEPILARPAGSLRKTWSWSQKNPWVFTGGFALMMLLLACVAYGLWEKSRFLTWRLEAGKSVSSELADSPAVLFFKLFPALCFLLYFAGNAFRRDYRARSEGGAVPGARALAIHSALGMFGTVCGTGFLFLQIKSWAWSPLSPWFFVLELAGILCALVLNWLGFRMVWEAIGIHESSRFRNVVGQALDRQIQAEPGRWPMFKLVVLPLLIMACSVGLVVFVKWTVTGVPTSISGRAEAIAFAKRPMTIPVGLLSFAVAMATINQAVWALRLRRDLLRNLFLPGVAYFYFLYFGMRFLNSNYWESFATFLVGALVGAGVAIIRQLFIRPTAEQLAARPDRFPGKPWRQTLAGLALFISVLVLIHLVENWWGIRMWRQTRTELEANGMKLYLRDILPSPVSDEQNVMEHPFIQKFYIKGTPGAEANRIANPPTEAGRSVNDRIITIAQLRELPAQPATPRVLVASLAAKDSAERNLPRKLVTYGKALPPSYPYWMADLVRALALQAGIKIVIDDKPPFVSNPVRVGGSAARRSVRVDRIGPENLTAAEALDELFSRESLALEFDSSVSAYRLKPRTLTRADLTDWFARTEGDWKQLEEALHRPNAQLKSLDTEFPNDPDTLSHPIPNFVGLRGTAQALAMRSRIHLLEGNPEAAQHDVEMLHRLQDCAVSSPSLVCSMMKVSIAGLLEAIVEEGLSEGLWKPDQLAAIQRLCAADNLLATLRGGFEADRIHAIGTIRLMAGDRRNQTYSDFAWSDLSLAQFLEVFSSSLTGRASERLGPDLLVLKCLLPRGVLYKNMADVARLEVLPRDALSADSLRVNPARLAAHGRAIDNQLNRPTYFGNALTWISTPNFFKAAQSVVAKQTQLDFALVACALERHRAAKGAYPDTLTALVPEFAPALPHDLFDGQPLRYRRTDDGKYLLYSIGWNSKDDGGVVATDKAGKPEWSNDTGDWVWQGVPKK